MQLYDLLLKIVKKRKSKDIENMECENICRFISTTEICQYASISVYHLISYKVDASCHYEQPDITMVSWHNGW